MAIIKPFKAVRPANEYVKMVAELPYDVMNREEAKKIAKGNKYSYLHIDRAEIDLDDKINEHDEQVYVKAKENLDKFKKENIFVKDKEDAIYIYREIVNDRAQIGIVACVAVDDNLNGVVKKHEYTKPDKELDRTNHIKYCNANTGTVLLTYKDNEEIDKIMDYYVYFMNPIYDFKTDDGVTHTVWKVEKERDINNLINEFKKVGNLYIADGHHRCAAAENIALEERRKNPNYTGEEEFNYFLSVVFPYDQLCILPYNRIVRDLNGLTVKAFLGALKFNFELMLMPGFPCKPVEKHCMGMYVDGQWYHLKAWPDVYEKKDVVGQLDVSILQEKVLTPILGIEDPRTDQRISFVGGSHKAAELAAIADKTGGVAFVMYPTSMEDLMEIADESKLMPPKSTWFEPKLRSGLFIHKL